MKRVLFVCLGNICRSPTAEGVLLHMAKERGVAAEMEVDSAGTAAYHIGESPDPRTAEAAHKRGYDLPSRGRQAKTHDFEKFDLVVAMDRSNYTNLKRLRDKLEAPNAELRLFSEYLSPDWPEDVPDPYYGGEDGFERVLDMVEEGCRTILDEALNS